MIATYLHFVSGHNARITNSTKTTQKPIQTTQPIKDCIADGFLGSKNLNGLLIMFTPDKNDRNIIPIWQGKFVNNCQRILGSWALTSASKSSSVNPYFAQNALRPRP
jgi:hypothetical protein